LRFARTIPVRSPTIASYRHHAPAGAEESKARIGHPRDREQERIDGIPEENRELFDTISSGAERHRKLGLTQDELFGLFDLKCPEGPVKFAA